MTARILVVDDQRTVRAFIRLTLAALDMDVVEAKDGAEALALLGPGHGFDVVITDLKMPTMDGDTLVARLQGDPALASLPIVILTGSDAQSDEIRNLEAGASAYITKSKDSAVLVATVRRLARQKLRQDELQRDSHTDPLTGLNNRRYGDAWLAQELERCRRYGGTFSVAMLDIDHFKRINDSLGHASGDDVLVNVATSLRSISRATDLVLRWGGEEFMFAFCQTDLLRAASIVERFRSHLAAHPVKVRAVGVDVPVTISGGVAELEPGDTLQTLVERADSALYKAKESGRNRLLMWQLGQLRTVDAA